VAALRSAAAKIRESGTGESGAVAVAAAGVPWVHPAGAERFLGVVFSGTVENSEMAKTPTLKDIAALGFIGGDIELLCVVKGETFLDNLNGLKLSSSEYRQFPAVLKNDGRIHFPNGEAYPYPATASRAVRRVVESRSDRIPEKTGGWLYWHFKDNQTGGWCQIRELQRRAESCQKSIK
jgi:hypothetical protein